MSASRPLLVVGNRNYSSWSLRGYLALAPWGVDVELRVLPMRTPTWREAIGTLSPTGWVPVLHHDGRVVWDSLAIAEYASEALLDGRGWPAERGARARARSIACEMHSGFAALRTECPMNIRRRPRGAHPLSDSARADVARVLAIWRECRAAAAAHGPFLFGAWSHADAFYAPVVFRFASYGIAVDPVAAAYMDAVRAHPAVAAWVADAEAETDRLDHYDAI